MDSSNEYPWPFYSELQSRCSKSTQINGYSWGLESVLDALTTMIELGSVPKEPRDLIKSLNRAMATAARRQRARSLKLKHFAPPGFGDPIDPVKDADVAVEAKAELKRILHLVSVGDREVLLRAGLGHTDREIASARHCSPGSVRIKLSRLRLKLAA